MAEEPLWNNPAIAESTTSVQVMVSSLSHPWGSCSCSVPSSAPSKSSPGHRTSVHPGCLRAPCRCPEALWFCRSSLLWPPGRLARASTRMVLSFFGLHCGLYRCSRGGSTVFPRAIHSTRRRWGSRYPSVSPRNSSIFSVSHCSSSISSRFGCPLSFPGLPKVSP